jgi:glycerophosphoryl diester phosphodiesterase
LQEKIFANKPLLKEVIYEVEKYVEKNDLRTPNYNIEIKSHKEGDDIFHPHFEKFSDLVYSEIIKLLPIERFNIQSFDFRVLKYFNKKYPKIKLSVLVDNNYNPKKNLNDLGFVPYIFSPNFRKLNILDIKYMKSKKIKIIPWTVNSYNDITEVLKLNVDGIISDYPERVINTIE